jgi:hypothetical protein
MSTLKQKSNEKKENVNTDKTFTETNNSDWVAYGKGVIFNLIKGIIFIMCGIAFLFGVKHLGVEKYLPTDVRKPPYNPIPGTPFPQSIPYVTNTKIPDLYEMITRNIGGSMSGVRSVLSSLYNTLGYYNQTDQLKFIDYIIFLFSPLFIFILSLILPVVGFFSLIMSWWNVETEFFIKFFALIAIYFGAFFLGIYQSFYMVFFLIYSLSIMYKEKMISKYVPKLKGVIYFIFTLAIVTPAFGNIWYPYLFGIVLAAIFPYLGLLF